MHLERREKMKLQYVSARGDVLTLSENKYFNIANVDAMTTATAALSSSTTSGGDGDTVTNAQAPPRGIVLDLEVKPDINVEEAKREVLKIVKLKQRGTLILTQNERTVQITGVVEIFDMPRWTNAVIMQITLHCEQPFWEDVENVVQQISEAIDLHYFTTSGVDMLYFPADGIPFGEYDTIRTKSFYNDGDVDVGLEITILAHDTVTNPIIYDRNGNFFGLGYRITYTSEPDADGNATSSAMENPFVMQAGDNVVISTHKGRKTVKYNGVLIFDKIKPNSTWLQLETGDNQFSIDSDDESISNMSFSLIYKQRYI